MKYLCTIFLIVKFAIATASTTKANLGIVNGLTILPHFAPYLAFLSINGSMDLRCGGSLITENYILTSATCLKYSTTVRVVLGADDVTVQEESQVSYDVTPNLFVIHEDFNEASLENDIGVIKLPNPAPLNENITIISLAQSADDLVGQEVITLGWGTQSGYLPDTNLLSAKPYAIWILVMEKYNSQCGEVFGDRIKDTNICCTSETIYQNNLNLCTGDFGGPLILNYTLQIGVSSFTSYPCNGMPNVFTDVSQYIPWIVQNTDLTL